MTHTSDKGCGCVGHVMPGVMHFVPCCNVPHITEAEYQKAGGLTARTAPVQGHGTMDGRTIDDVPAGIIEWEEHYEAWENYSQLYPGQDAETLAELGGFSWNELVEFLGRVPKTWRPNQFTRFKEIVMPTGKVDRA